LTLLLRLISVSKSFSRRGSSKLALDGVSLEIPRGRMVGVFGATGAGKTTLLKVASGLLAPDSGVVEYEHDRIDRMPSSETNRLRRREISCVWAEESPERGFDVRDHVAMPLLVDGRKHRIARRLADDLLALCGVEECVHMPLEDLSDGERQLVELARALITEPKLLLADALISRLSIDERGTILALLASLAHDRQMGILITNPDSRGLLGVDDSFYLRDGKLIGASEGGERGRLYRLPTAGANRTAADA
jgi:putative ABC transport system ATP-binding protein